MTFIDNFIGDDMTAIETMSFPNYEINARCRECIKPDLNEDYISLFSASVPIIDNQFLFSGDTSKRLEDIEKTNKVVRKAMVQQSSFSRQRHDENNSLHTSRGRGPRPQIKRGYTQRPFFRKTALLLWKSVSETVKKWEGNARNPKYNGSSNSCTNHL